MVDLKEILSRYNSGESSLGTIEPEIRSYSDFYKELDESADADEVLGRFERQSSLANDLNELLQVLREDDDASRVWYKGRILTTAASLLGAEAESYATFQLAQHLKRIRSFERALILFRRVEELSTGDSEESKALRGIAASDEITCLENLGRWAEMEGVITKLLEDTVVKESPAMQSLLLRDLGVAYSGQTRYDEAIDVLRTALKIRLSLAEKGVDERNTTSQIYDLTGKAARAAGRYEEALTAFQSAREILLARSELWPAAFEMSEIGITWYLIGEHTRAREYLEIAAREAEKLGKSGDAARWRGDLPTQQLANDDASVSQLLTWAAALLRQEPPRTREARQLLAKCIDKAKDLGEKGVEADARNTLAASYELEGNYYQAATAVQSAIRLTQELQDKPREITLRTNLAIMLSKGGRINDAEAQLRLAIELSLAVRATASTTEFRQAIIAGLENTYDTLALLMAKKWEGLDGSVIKEKRGDRLLELAQEASAANFARWVALEGGIERQQEDLHEALLALRAAETRMEMSALTKGVDISNLLEQQVRSRERFANRAIQLGTSITLEKPIFSAAELSKLLQPGECLVDLYATSRVIIINCLGPDGRLATELCRWLRAERLDFFQRWKEKVFSKPGSRAALGGPPLSELLEELDERFIGKLVEVISECGRFDHITIVPHREMSLVPYWAISKHLPEARVSIVPGTNIYKLLRDRKRELLGSRLALGDATNTLEHVSTELKCLPEFELLPYSIDEIIRRLPTASLVHIACHGRFNDKNPYLSGLVAAPAIGTQNDREFGARTIFGEPLLTVAEILAKVRLPRCFLVVLSACCSGIPRQHPASELVGLPSALVIAGSQNVIASLWPVNDGAASLMMQEFYVELFKAGVLPGSPSTALRVARKKVIEMPRDEVLDRLGEDFYVPDSGFPYSGPQHAHAFQHFGID
jgi:tetratricopeptide (TPR) repeat protein